MLAIPINKLTAEMLSELNAGVVPEIEEDETFFIYKGKNIPPEIVTYDDMVALAGFWTIFKIGFIPNP